jgi:integrase/recombinase XerC
MRQAFATYADRHEAASIRRCWSTWNTLCWFLFTAELLTANPMQLVGRPKLAKTLPKSLPQPAVEALLNAVAAQGEMKRRSEWPERDRAIILTALLAGLRAQEIRGANIGDLRVTHNHGAVIQVRGKGTKDRNVPIEQALIEILNEYLTSRASRFRGAARRHRGDSQLRRWPANAPLFVGSNGQRITRGTLQYRVLRAFKLAGAEAQRIPGALVHALRHTYATELANTHISVYTLMKLLGHESMATSQRYVISAGSETRAAAAQNPLYGLAVRTRLPTPAGLNKQTRPGADYGHNYRNEIEAPDCLPNGCQLMSGTGTADTAHACHYPAVCDSTYCYNLMAKTVTLRLSDGAYEAAKQYAEAAPRNLLCR